MDAADLEAYAAPMLDDLAVALAPYGIDAADPEAQIRVVASLCGVLLARAEALGVRRGAELWAAIECAVAAGAALGPACTPRCACREAA